MTSDLRYRLGMTQEEFAHAIGVTVTTVNRWENGHRKPSRLARKAIEVLEGKGKGVREVRRKADAHLLHAQPAVGPAEAD